MGEGVVPSRYNRTKLERDLAGLGIPSTSIASALESLGDSESGLVADVASLSEQAASDALPVQLITATGRRGFATVQEAVDAAQVAAGWVPVAGIPETITIPITGNVVGHSQANVVVQHDRVRIRLMDGATGYSEWTFAFHQHANDWMRPLNGEIAVDVRAANGGNEPENAAAKLAEAINAVLEPFACMAEASEVEDVWQVIISNPYDLLPLWDVTCFTGQETSPFGDLVTAFWAGGTGIYYNADLLTSAGEIRLAPGVYDEQVVVCAPLRIVCDGAVAITGIAARGYGCQVIGDAKITNVSPYDPRVVAADSFAVRTRPDAAGTERGREMLRLSQNGITGLGRLLLGGGVVDKSPHSSIMCARLPGPYVSRAPNVCALVSDDNSTTLMTEFAGFGGLNIFDYAISKGVALSIGVNSAASDWNTPSIDAIKAMIEAGGEVNSHSRTHYAVNPYAEWVQSKAELEAMFGFPILAATHRSGDYPLNSERSKALAQQSYPVIRNGGGVGYEIMPASRTPTCKALDDDYGITAAEIVREVKTFGQCQGRAMSWFFHGLTDGAAGAQLQNVLVMKAMIDALAEEQDAGRIAVIPFWQLAAQLPAPNVAPNFFENPGFEYADDDDLVDGAFVSPVATVQSGGAIVQVAGGHTGNCCKMTGSGTKLQYGKYAVTPGAQYVLDFWHKSAGSATNNLNVIIIRGGFTGDDRFITIPVTNAGDWTQMKPRRIVFPAVTDHIWIAFQVGGSDSEVYLDDMFFGMP